MPKKFLKRYTPDHAKLREHKHLQIFGDRLHNPNLWHMNRRSVSGAFAVGLFNAAIPVPFQMLLAAAGAILFRVNLPISVALVWVTNPLTMPPLFYIAYLVGAWVLDVPLVFSQNDFQLSWEWLGEQLLQVWEPFLLGCAILAVVGAAAGYVFIRLLWRFHVVIQWRKRRHRPQSKHHA